MSALSGINTALWDIFGKSLGVPISTLLGGRQRSRVRTYSWVGGDDPHDLVTAAGRAMQEGFDAVKFNASGRLQYSPALSQINDVVQRIGELRDAFGDRLDIAVDFHGRVHASVARTLLRELEPLRPMWVEDPVAADNTAAVIELGRSTSIPIAVGERVHSRSEFNALLESRAVGILNADPAHIGGITEAVRLAGCAEAYDVMIAPHCPLGPIALAACLQVDAACYNAVIQEQSLGIQYNVSNDLLDYVVGEPFRYDSGYLTIPDGPGLGIEIDEELVTSRAHAGHDWRAPVWRHLDGSIAEW